MSNRSGKGCLPLIVGVLGISVIALFVGFGGCRQSRDWSRITGKPLQLTLPDDFATPVSFSSGREGEKDLFYRSVDDKLKVKTYTDSGIWEAEIEFVENTDSGTAR